MRRHLYSGRRAGESQGRTDAHRVLLSSTLSTAQLCVTKIEENRFTVGIPGFVRDVTNTKNNFFSKSYCADPVWGHTFNIDVG